MGTTSGCMPVRPRSPHTSAGAPRLRSSAAPAPSPNAGSRRCLSRPSIGRAPIAGFRVNLATPSSAEAAPMPLMPADSVDYYDVGDSLVQFGAPTMPLVKLSVGTDGKVTLEMPRLEQGQGIATALGMMIAEEMDVPLSDVIVHSADAQPELRYNQITGGSSSIRCFDPVLPVMAAAARARLVAYAAQQWGLSPSSLRVEAGVVIAPDGRSATYGSLTVGAATLPLPSAQPKDPSQYKVIGHFTERLDARA